MIDPPVPSPMGLWGPSAVFPWQGDTLLPLVSFRLGRVDEKGGNGAPTKCGWEDVVFASSRDLGEVLEVGFLCIFE